MSYKIIIQPRDEKELNESHLYYEEQSAGLGDRFFKELDDMFRHFSQSPEMYSNKKGNFQDSQPEYLSLSNNLRSIQETRNSINTFCISP